MKLDSTKIFPNVLDASKRGLAIVAASLGVVECQRNSVTVRYKTNLKDFLKDVGSISKSTRFRQLNKSTLELLSNIEGIESYDIERLFRLFEDPVRYIVEDYEWDLLEAASFEIGFPLLCHPVSEFVANQYKNSDTSVIGCSFEGTLGIAYLIHRGDGLVAFSCKNPYVLAIADLFLSTDPRNLALDGGAIEWKTEESKFLPREVSFHNCVTFPTIGWEYALSAVEELLVPTGVTSVIAILPTKFLWENKPEVQSFRKKLCDGRFIRTIIKLPTRAVSSTSAELSIFILCPAGSYDEGIHYLDLSENFSLSKSKLFAEPCRALKKLLDCPRSGPMMSFDEILLRDYNLDPKRYGHAENAVNRLCEQFETSSLSEVAEITRCQSIKHSEEGDDYTEINSCDLDQYGFLHSRSKHIKVGQEGMKRAKQASIQPGDILFPVKCTVGKIGFVPEVEEGERLVGGQSFALVRVRDKYKRRMPPEVLFRYLKSDACQLYIKSRSLGQHIQSLRKADIDNLPVPIPDEEFVKYQIKCFHRQQEILKQVSVLFKEFFDLEKFADFPETR